MEVEFVLGLFESVIMNLTGVVGTIVAWTMYRK